MRLRRVAINRRQDLGDQVAAPQSIEVTLDGENLGVFSAGWIPDANPLSATSDWQEFATAAFLGSPGNHTVTFTGLGPNGATSSITLDNLQAAGHAGWERLRAAGGASPR